MRLTAFLVGLLASGCGSVSERLEPLSRPALSPRAPQGVTAEARGWLLRAEVAEGRGDLEEAERSWGWVLRLEPDEPASWVAYGRFLERQRRQSEAAEAYREALQRDEQWGRAHLHLGDLLVRAEVFEEAAGHLERSLRHGETEAYEVLARLYRRMDRTPDHRHLVDRWLAEPDLSVAERASRAGEALAAGRPDAAVEDLLMVIAERDDPLMGELLVEAALQTCHATEVAGALARLGVDADPRYQASNARLAAGLAAPDPACDAAAPQEPR